LPRLAEALLAHVNVLSEFPEIPFQGVSRAFFYHAQKKKDKFFEGHFSLPGESFGSPAGPPFARFLWLPIFIHRHP
jgi:hypothetical protein